MHTPSLRVAVVASFVLAIVPLTHCTSGAPATPPSSGTIGPSGGALASADYALEILVPAGALSSDVTFTITPVNAPTGALAPAYTIDPAGQTFAAPVVVSFAEGAISGTAFNDPSDYRVAAFVSNAWALLPNASLDSLANTIEGTTTFLQSGAYSVALPTGTACVNVTEACTEGEDGGGCAVATCDPSVPGKCATYAGAFANSCTASSTGITVSCCYPTGEPVCFVQYEPDGCESPCSQLPGSTAQSCVPDVGPPLDNGWSGGLPQSTCCFAAGAPVCMANHATGSPAPRCATSSPCAAFPGTSVSSCSDVSDGTEATCCLPVGTLPGTLPSGGTAVDGGPVVVAVDSGADANQGPDANQGADANGGTDANGTEDAGTDTGTDAGTPDTGAD